MPFKIEVLLYDIKYAIKFAFVTDYQSYETIKKMLNKGHGLEHE